MVREQMNLYFFNIFNNLQFSYHTTITLGIFKFLYDLILYFFDAIATVITSSAATVAAIFGSGITQIFANYGNSIRPYGIWAPVVMVLSIGIAGAVVYIILSISGSIEAID